MVLGTAQFGMDYGIANVSGKPTKKEVFNILSHAWEKGIWKFDTAPGYSSESLVGEFISTNGLQDKAKVLTKDSQNDIAVLKLAQSPSTQFPDLKFGDSSKIRPGDKVFTIGYPASSILGKNQKITDGIISSITGVEDDPTMFQITVPIQPGNS